MKKPKEAWVIIFNEGKYFGGFLGPDIPVSTSNLRHAIIFETLEEAVNNYQYVHVAGGACDVFKVTFEEVDFSNLK